MRHAHAKVAMTLFALVTLTAAQGAQVGAPDFSVAGSVAWIAQGGDFIAPESGPRPVTYDPAHPFVVGAIPDPYIADSSDTRRPSQFTWRVADLSNPILQPWAREELSKRRDRILAGGTGYNRQVACWPVGVPAFLLGAVDPVFIIQTPEKVVMIWQNDHQVRHIYLNVPHSANPKPSWYGESIGRYEGDTLVVDTIGLNTKTFVDNYRTPHTLQLHTVERFRMIEGGRMLEVNVHVENMGAFTTAWNAVQRYRRVEPGLLIEAACAENNTNPFHQDIEPMPVADTPDF
jgi:hypothetical protein